MLQAALEIVSCGSEPYESKKMDKECFYCIASEQRDGFWKDIDDMVFFFPFLVNKELVTFSAHSFSPAWGCVTHADFQALTCKISL